LHSTEVCQTVGDMADVDKSRSLRYKADTMLASAAADVERHRRAKSKQKPSIIPQRPEVCHPHHWIYLYDEVWVCRECNELTWLPITPDSAMQWQRLLQRTMNWQKAYNTMIKGTDVECLINLMEESITNGRKNRKNKAGRKSNTRAT